MGLIGSVRCQESIDNEYFTEENCKPDGSDHESRDNGNDMIYYDDISGAPLKTDLVEEAIQEEMDQYRKHEFHTKVPISQAWKGLGKNQLVSDGSS